jgi:2-haloacid dehalogenase
VVNWHKSIMREIAAMKLHVDPDKFALAWRAGYMPAMQRVMSGQLGWSSIDDLHRMILDDLLDQFKVTHLNEEEKRHLNKAWHRLDAWPDTVAGLTRLKSRYTICTLSNGNVGLLTEMAKRASLPWDCILSAEIFHKYKPDPATYLGVARIFDVDPGEVMMVAAHQDDLAHARGCGLKTAYIERPEEYGCSQIKDVSPHPDNTLHARNLVELAVILGC